ncbi:WD40-repeat-containing domain protein [Phakopsora pachyrhizi]|nr:WD40-repeat-containing domain protein [Phakopsora pachyrhizi]
MNEDDFALVLAGTADGNVRIYRDYDRPDKTEVVTAFKALPNNEPSTHSDAGVIVSWQQRDGSLIVGGNSREIKIWNSERESCVESVKTRANSCLSSLTTDQVVGDLICAGFGDGSMRIYDRRMASKSTMVKVYRGFHSSWINCLKMQSGGTREIISGDTVGDVGVWDIRLDSPIKVVNLETEGMPSMSLHDHLPICATGSLDGTVKMWEIKTKGARDVGKAEAHAAGAENDGIVSHEEELASFKKVWDVNYGGGGRGVCNQPVTSISFHV